MVKMNPKDCQSRRRSQRQEPRRFRSQRSRFQQIRVVKVDSSQRLVTRKEKAKVKVRRTHKTSLRQIQRIVPRQQFLVSSGQRAHATGGNHVRFFTRVQRASLQRSQRRLRRQMQRRRLQWCLQWVVLGAQLPVRHPEMVNQSVGTF